MNDDLTLCQKAERSITKKYRKQIWNKFIMAVKEYELRSLCSFCSGTAILTLSLSTS